MLQKITNAELRQTDFAQVERHAFLRQLSRRKLRRPARVRGADYQSYALTNDARSVRYQLDGKRSLRVAWWTFFKTFHQVLFRSDLEGAMYAYHALHQEITYLRIKIWHDSRVLTCAIRKHGVLQGLWIHCVEVAEDLKRPVK